MSDFKRGFWRGFEAARHNPDSNDIQDHYQVALAIRNQPEHQPTNQSCRGKCELELEYDRRIAFRDARAEAGL